MMLDFSDPVDLARIQFAFTVSAHIFFPAFTIGLASYLAVLEGLWLWTRDQAYLLLFEHWKKIFAVAFGMGVVSGVVMSYQVGTNWSVFSDRTGPTLGPLMGYEVLTAFFLEAGFLGVMLFGMNRVGPRLHFLATLMVAFGTLISAFWILAANSWMHTPAGYEVNAAGQFVPVDWWGVIFNPSFPYRFAHMVVAAYLTTAFVIGGAGAWHLLRGRRDPQTRIMFSMAMWMALLAAPLQIGVGDLHALNTLEHQPAKIAAMEGHYESRSGAPLILFGLPDDAAERTRYTLAIPKLSSLLLTHDRDGELRGLKAFPPQERPSAEVVFWSFRIMVALGLAMTLICLWSGVARYRNRLFESRWLHRAMVLMAPSGFAAVLAGWITTEVGRQPWTVHGLLKTADSIAPIEAPTVAGSLILFVLIYFAVFGAGTYYAMHLMSRPPGAGDTAGPAPNGRRHVQPGTEADWHGD